jgi:hypothetical protein
MLAEAIALSGGETPTRTRLRWWDESLARLGRGESRIRLRVGEDLEELASSGGIGELGMSSVKAYVIERCERRWKWGAETQTMARRLRKLPEIRSALMDGRMLWSMADVLCRHATPENEAELVIAARGQTVKSMKQRLTVRTEMAAWWERDDDALQEVRIAMGIGEVAIVEATRLLVERIDGAEASDGRFVDALLGEGQTAMLDLERDARAAAEVDEEEERRLEREARARESRERARELAEGAIPPVVPIGIVDGSEGRSVVRRARSMRMSCGAVARCSSATSRSGSCGACSRRSADGLRWGLRMRSCTRVSGSACRCRRSSNGRGLLGMRSAYP